MILRCKTSFHAYGRPTMVRAGDLVDSSDPVVRGREELFESVDEVVHGPADLPVESASAAPGERRSVKRPARKAAATPDED